MPIARRPVPPSRTLIAGRLSFGKWGIKDPDEALDFAVDWSRRLSGDHLAAVEFIVEEAAGVSLYDGWTTASAAMIWISGGTVGQTAQILCRVTTEGGRTMDQSLRLAIRDR